MKKQIYSIQDLENYLLKKKNGHIDLVIEQRIKDDDLLHTVLIGLEKELRKNKAGSITSILNDKKQNIWWSLLHTSIANNTTSARPNISFLQRINQNLSSRGYDFNQVRFHLLLGFNCSCVLALIIALCWIIAPQESSHLISTLDELGGYKP